jgi:hypothetical protein
LVLHLQHLQRWKWRVGLGTCADLDATHHLQVLVQVLVQGVLPVLV